MRRVIHIRSKNIDAVERMLNRISSRTTILGSPVWTGVEWVVWMVTEDSKIKSGSID